MSSVHNSFFDKRKSVVPDVIVSGIVVFHVLNVVFVKKWSSCVKARQSVLKAWARKVYKQSLEVKVTYG